MSRPQRYTAEDIIAALRKTRGMVYLAANELGCSHVTVYNYIKKYATVKREFEHQRGEFKDVAETKLREATDNGEKWAIQFALTMLGSDRGYVQKRLQEVSGPEGGPVKLENVIRIIVHGDTDGNGA